MWTAVLIGWGPKPDPPPTPISPHFGSYTRALLVSQDRRHLFVTPLFWAVIYVKNQVTSNSCRPSTTRGQTSSTKNNHWNRWGRERAGGGGGITPNDLYLSINNIFLSAEFSHNTAHKIKSFIWAPPALSVLMLYTAKFGAGRGLKEIRQSD